MLDKLSLSGMLMVIVEAVNFYSWNSKLQRCWNVWLTQGLIIKICLSFSRAGAVSTKTQLSGHEGIFWNDAGSFIILNYWKPKVKSWILFLITWKNAFGENKIRVWLESGCAQSISFYRTWGGSEYVWPSSGCRGSTAKTDRKASQYFFSCVKPRDNRQN